MSLFDYEKKESAFKNSQLFTKAELLKSVNLSIEHINNDQDTDYTEEFKSNLVGLYNKFKKLLEKSMLPKLTEDWLCYIYDFTGAGIELSLCSYSEIELDENDEINTATTTIEHKLISVKCDYLTVEQYANIQKVNTETVRQWIRRGKLRHAKKSGEDWLIPSIEGKPSRSYLPVQYEWQELPAEFLEEYPFFSMCKSLFIYQDENDKSKYMCALRNFETKQKFSFELTRKEVEKLELDLISSGKTKVDGILIQFLPAIER